jgi:hypothetical protein
MGRRRLERIQFPTYRVQPKTLKSLKSTAVELGFTYGDGAAMGEFLDRLAELDRDLLKLVFDKSPEIDE